MEDESLVNYLEQHPEYYEVVQAGVYMKVLEFISKAAPSLDDFYAAFPEVEVKDLELIIRSLIALKLVEQTRSPGGKNVYYLSENAKILLKKYKEGQKYKI